MFYDNDYTSLNGGAVNIPMAEGYDCSYGAALALVESARNDLAMFNAMLNVEAAEHRILKESTGYVQEGELQALQEASVSGLWNKIKELFSKLIAKIKAIFHTFLSKVDSLFKTDKQMVKKYRTEINRKSNLGKMEVKWRKLKTPGNLSNYNENYFTVDDKTDVAGVSDLADQYETETDARFKKVVNKYIDAAFSADNSSDLRDELFDKYFSDDAPEKYELNETGESMQTIMSFLEDSSKISKAVGKYVSKTTSNLGKIVKDADKKAKEEADKHGKKDSTGGTVDNSTNVETANHTFAAAQTYESVILVQIAAKQEAFKIVYKQAKAAFMKAIAANDKKLEENALYLDALAEAAENEVEDVISGALSSSAEYTNLASTSNAPKAVKDGGVSDDPDHLIGKGYDDPTYHKDKVDGTIGSDYNGKESFFNFDFN